MGRGFCYFCAVWKIYRILRLAFAHRCSSKPAGTLGRSHHFFSSHFGIDCWRRHGSSSPSKRRILKPFLFGKQASDPFAREDREICRGEGEGRTWMMDASLLLNYPLFLAVLPAYLPPRFWPYCPASLLAILEFGSFLSPNRLLQFSSDDSRAGCSDRRPFIRGILLNTIPGTRSTPRRFCCCLFLRRHQRPRNKLDWMR